ncbi:MAG: nucleotidyl transferase AbiEii/AbiGii toxin family protein [Treponema sp.]|nr:nucleotidyl transferase AbiEii/AbiGii toxin family protein [Treponema sp.]
MLNKHYKEILLILSEKKVKFLLVGAYAMAVHGYPRSTMDIDLFVMPDPENAVLVLQALDDFGAPVKNLSAAELQKEGLIFQIGVAPCRIDILTSIDGINFEDAYARSETFNIDEVQIHVLSVHDLIVNKRASGRIKDLADAETLEEGLV